MTRSIPERSGSYPDAERAIVFFLRAFEDAQQTILFQDIAATRERLRAAVGDELNAASRDLEDDTRGAGRQRDVLMGALVHLNNAYGMFSVDRAWPDFATAYLSSRGQQCRALEMLYAARGELPAVEGYFRFEENIAPASANTATGISHHGVADGHGEYSLYVPEYYDAARAWPMIVCLHGSHGRGDEYLWTWLRAARSSGYVVLSPKSFGLTWSIMQPELDTESVLAMIELVSGAYAIDRSRILVTGLSDGGTFSYLIGLNHPDSFRACAPIAGVLSPAVDPLLRAQRGVNLPFHVVHGVHDAIFPVQTIRSTNDLLESLGYQLTYTELPDWGHALTYSINENIVLPWFENIAAGAA